jgi:hypothetical protein
MCDGGAGDDGIHVERRFRQAAFDRATIRRACISCVHHRDAVLDDSARSATFGMSKAASDTIVGFPVKCYTTTFRSAPSQRHASGAADRR